jgi:hypothetical protein
VNAVEILMPDGDAAPIAPALEHERDIVQTAIIGIGLDLKSNSRRIFSVTGFS